jgi:hypothetical protein
MSHYARNPREGRDFLPTNVRICYCLNCGVEMAQSLTFGRKGTKKFCPDCKSSLTNKQKIEIVDRLNKHRTDQKNAKRMRNIPSEQRFIFNSPFRK